MYKIEQDIPLPPERRGRRARYPFANMSPGESFLVTGAADQLGAIRRAAHGYGQRSGKRFMVRLVPEGVRVWCAESKAGDAGESSEVAA
jgi:hypothetical protein